MPESRLRPVGQSPVVRDWAEYQMDPGGERLKVGPDAFPGGQIPQDVLDRRVKSWSATNEAIARVGKGAYHPRLLVEAMLNLYWRGADVDHALTGRERRTIIELGVRPRFWIERRIVRIEEEAEAIARRRLP